MTDCDVYFWGQYGSSMDCIIRHHGEVISHVTFQALGVDPAGADISVPVEINQIVGKLWAVHKDAQDGVFSFVTPGPP